MVCWTKHWFTLNVKSIEERLELHPVLKNGFYISALSRTEGMGPRRRNIRRRWRPRPDAKQHQRGWGWLGRRQPLALCCSLSCRILRVIAINMFLEGFWTQHALPAEMFICVPPQSGEPGESEDGADVLLRAEQLLCRKTTVTKLPCPSSPSKL